MPYRYSFKFRDLVPGERPLTKFGGQPDWLAEPQWPLSRKLGQPMRFVCQIEIPRALFPTGSGGLPGITGALTQSHLDLLPPGPQKVVYLFLTDNDGSGLSTWDPHDGENAVSLQTAGPVVEPCRPLATGPTLQKLNDHGEMPQLLDAEFGIDAWESEDPAFLKEPEVMELTDEERERYRMQTGGNKIGGVPGFIQSDEFPDSQRRWHLLLQLDTAEIPFQLDLGDVGVGYLFIDSAATEARFLWQCS